MFVCFHSGESETHDPIRSLATSLLLEIAGWMTVTREIPLKFAVNDSVNSSLGRCGVSTGTSTVSRSIRDPETQKRP